MTRATQVFGTVTAGAAATALLAAGTISTADATSGQRHPGHHHRGAVSGQLVALNSSGVHGWAKVKVHKRYAKVSYIARGVAANLPHAAHLHFSMDSRHECPTIQDDSNNDFRLNVAEGQPAYGMIKKSLTTRGDTSPASGLAVDRFPTAPRGVIRYERWVKVDWKVKRAIRHGNVAIVVHGNDYNGNGAYDFRSAGASELDSSLPAEATDPVACGILD